MSIRMLNGYWTIFVREQPVVSCATFHAAWAAVYELSVAL